MPPSPMKTVAFPLAIALGLALPLSALAQDAPKPAPAPAPAPAGSPVFITEQKVEEIGLANSVGEDVFNLAGENIGEIKDFVVDAEGMVRAAVIGVGGVLGVGEKNVAVDFRSLRMTRDPSGNGRVVLDASKDSLKAAPAYRYASERRG